MTDIQLQDSIIRRLTVIAEAAKRISEETRNSLTGIPWTAINGMRNRLVHEYDDVDLDILWNVIQIEIPSLVIALKPHVSPSP